MKYSGDYIPPFNVLLLMYEGALQTFFGKYEPTVHLTHRLQRKNIKISNIFQGAFNTITLQGNVEIF
jgi:hypothetical protein